MSRTFYLNSDLGWRVFGGFKFVFENVVSDLYIVNKSNAPRDVSGVTEQKNERAVCCERSHGALPRGAGLRATHSG